MKTIAAILLMGIGTAFGELNTTIAPMSDPPLNADFKSDWLTLTIKNGTNTLYSHGFVSAYGEAHADIFTAPWGKYLLLRYGVGRGTSARTEYVAVFEMLDYLVEVVRFPVSGYAGPGALWEYSYTVQAKTNGLEIALARKVDHYSPESTIMALPSDSSRTIRIGTGPNQAPGDTARKLADPQR
jgi:hypothetical protein